MIDRIQKVYGVGAIDPVKRRTGQKSQTEGTAEGGGSDGLEVSAFGRELTKALGELRTIPDVRVDKVRELKDQIESGTYRVDSLGLASRLIEAGLLGDLE
ncbi:flagellar biosynthesis anti-sigma factor FlgM [Aminirod propionatiphilus]|uniref:Flagellar biosynthesis anti-sigma factor FlgM n=1 Tax=Aminirod propionatiphilus TaxID=3415223 RepID=A0ACD1DT21_9BACT|nr:flagellar biosynthesis anti-sigma factor FlgM [Synergistota bacterium]